VANGCSGDTITQIVAVNPEPTVTVTNASGVICSGEDLDLQLSNQPKQVQGTEFIWIRNNTTNVNGLITDTIGPNQDQITNSFTLGNQVFSVQNVGVQIVPVFDGCKGDTTTETVSINPVPQIISSDDTTICSGESLGYTIIPTFSNNVLYSAVPGISPNVVGEQTKADDSSPILPEVLTNITNTTQSTSYTLTASFENSGKKCVSLPLVLQVSVRPRPSAPLFSEEFNPDQSAGTTALCGGSSLLALAVANLQPGDTYNWTAEPSNVIIADPSNPQTAVSFPDSGVGYTAVISLQATSSASEGSCKSVIQQLSVDIGPGQGIEEKKIVPKQPGHLLVYLDNSSDLRYRWGVDSIINQGPITRLVQPRLLDGQVYQFFTPESRFIKPASGTDPEQLDTINYAYWVQVIKVSPNDTCYTRIYYNGPYCTFCSGKVTEEIAGEDVYAALWPNPVRDYFELKVAGPIYGRMEVSVMNSLGQIMDRRILVKEEANQQFRYDVQDLPSGIYQLFIRGNREEKISVKFIRVAP